MQDWKIIAVIQEQDGSGLAWVVTVGMERRKQSLKREAEVTGLSSSGIGRWGELHDCKAPVLGTL